MLRHWRHVPPLLRTTMMVLLVLGVLVRPVLVQISEAHAAEHAALATADHSHGGDHGHDHDDGDPELPSQDLPPLDHTQGTHGLMHFGDSGSATNIPALLALTLQSPPQGDLPMPDIGPRRSQAPSNPFRPPIA